MPDELILNNALTAAGMPAYRSPFVAGSFYLLTVIRLDAISGNTARVTLIYTTPEWGTSAYLIRDSTSLAQRPMQHSPGASPVPFRCSYKASTATDASSSSPENKVDILEDSITFNFPLPIRNIDITQISYGAPPTGLRPYVGYSNSDNFFGLGVGYWLLTRFESDLSKYQSSYTVSASISTQNVMDWSQYGVLQSKATGRYPDVTMAMAAASAKTYSYGIIYGTASGEKGNGLIRVGAYPVTSFTTLFPSLTA